jgi:RsiW-degrading membrane proteinase PrsW (M82 family)
MSHGLVFLVFSALAAAVSVAMWLDYFRRIDVFEREKPLPLLLALGIGGITPYISLFVYKAMARAGFSENGEWANDLLFAIFGVGLNEEVSKLLGVIVVFTLLKKHINEPIDVMIYAGVTALGFTMIENYNYFFNHGIRIITSRTFYSALEHIINTSIIVYGFYRHRLFNKGNHFLNTVFAFSLAICSHGLFDFFLVNTASGHLAAFVSLLIYLIGINFWIQMLNNANNFSAYFDYHKINFTPTLVYRLFYWYLLTVIIAFVNNTIIVSFRFSVITFIYGLLSDGFLFWVVILRVSRFKIFKKKYFTIYPQLPFYITKNGDEDLRIPLVDLPLKVRGENFKEHLLTKYLDRKVSLYPVNEKRSFIKEPTEATITNKHLLFDDVIVYSVSLNGFRPEKDILYLLKPKMRGIGQIGHLYPIEGLYAAQVDDYKDKLPLIDHKKLKFIEWVYLKTHD